METLTLLLAFFLSFASPATASGLAARMASAASAPQFRIMGVAAPLIASTTESRLADVAPPVAPTKGANPGPTQTRVAAVPVKVSPSPVPNKVVVKGRTYDAYVPAATKAKQEYSYSCEFDTAWVILKTNGFDVKVDQQAAIVGLSKGPEPYYKETKQGIFIYGGDITTQYSGNYRSNFLARSTGSAMRKLFEKYGLRVTPVNTREGIQDALLRGELVWIKTTVDFKTWRPATWVMPDGRTYKTVLGNDHAVTVMGFNKDVVVIRDVLGPTSTGLNRKYEYEVPWAQFMAAWGAQSFDGLAVGKPR